MKTRNTDIIYKNELNRACFQHDMALEESKEIQNMIDIKQN